MNNTANNCYEATWTKVEGVEVLAIPGLSVVACPANGRRNSARFDMIDMASREFLCQLLKSEVYMWMNNAAHTREVPYNSYCAALDTPLPVRSETHRGVVPQIDWNGNRIA